MVDVISPGVEQALMLAAGGRSSAARRGSMVVTAWSTRVLSGTAPRSAAQRWDAVNRTAMNAPR